MSARPIHEVFNKRARGIGHILRDRIPRMHGFKGQEKLVPVMNTNRDGTMMLQFYRENDHGAWIEFGNLQASGHGNIVYGEETILKAEDLGAVSEIVHNKEGVGDIHVRFEDLFEKTDSKESDKSGGTKTSITVSAKENIEGFASIEESITQEAHAEFAEKEGSVVKNERKGEESTVVEVGKDVEILETRQRVDSQIEVSAKAQFGFILIVGQHDHRWNHGWKGTRYRWDSWQQFQDVIKGEAPSNWPLAREFAKHPANHADFWALDDLDSEVRYTIRFEGKINKSYTVKEINKD